MRSAPRRMLVPHCAVAILVGLLVGCGSSHFVANAEDRRRLDALTADPGVAHVRDLRSDCASGLARYRRSSGEPLDLSGVDDSRVRCELSIDPPTAAHARVVAADLVRAAVDAGWVASMEAGSFAMARQIEGAWATMRLSVTADRMSATFTIANHTSRGFAPAAANVEAARPCLEALLAARRSPSCATGP